MFSRRRWLLAVLIVPPLAATALWALAPHMISHCGDMRRVKAKADGHALVETIAVYRRDHGALPTQAEGLSQLVAAGYLDKMPLDPWGREYRYVRTGDGYSVVCLGDDSKPDGTDLVVESRADP